VAVLALPIASTDAVLMLDVWYLLRMKVSCPFLSDWKVLVRSVLQAFVLGGCGIEPISLVHRKFWFLFLQGFVTMGLLLGLILVVRAV
jgi:hypothetical protein